MTEYKDGYPNERGMFKCLVDGKETYLIHHHCCNNGKHWWSYTSGHDVIADKIQFLDKKININDI